MKTFYLMALSGLLLLMSGLIGLRAQAVSPEKPGELKKVTLVCQWQAQAQFAGFYMAREKGFFRRYGLDVKIIHVEPAGANWKLLNDGTAEFATMFLSTALKQRHYGNKIVNIAQFSRRSSMLFVARKSSGIKTVSDLNNRRIGIWYSDFEEVPLRFLEINRIRGNIVRIGSGVNMLLYGGVDVLAVTSYNELHELMMAGLSADDLTVFPLNEHGLNIPEDGLYCREDYFNANRQTCLDFAVAAMEGWKYAAQNQEETLTVVERILKENHLPPGKVHQKWMLEECLRLIFPNGVDAADPTLSRESYYHTAELLLSTGKVSKFPRYDDFFAAGNNRKR